MALSIELPSQERCELIMLGQWYRARHSQGFRRRDEKIIGSNVDDVTGLERSEADLLPEGEAIRGPEFVFAAPVMPDRYAEECLLRDEADGSTPSLANVQALGILTDQPDLEADQAVNRGIRTTKEVWVMTAPMHERGRVEEELLYVQKNHPEWNARIRTRQGRGAWTREEAEAHAELLYRFQKVMLDFAKKGWLRLEPPTKFVSGEGYDYNRSLYDKGVDDRGLPWIATVTPEGLDEAERRIAGHPIYSKGAFSALEAMTGDMRAAAVQRNPWAAEKWRQETGAGS